MMGGSLAEAVYHGQKASSSEILSILIFGNHLCVGGVGTLAAGVGVGILGFGMPWELLRAALGGVG